MGYIYRITNTISKKCYIGESKEFDIETRWNGHKYAISRDKGCPALRDAVKKYGWDVFTFEVLIICFDEDRFQYEKEYIAKYNSVVPNGYNITEGGEGGGFTGKTHSEETRKKLSFWSKEYHKNPEVRKRKSEQAKKQMEGVDVAAMLANSEKWQKAKAEGRVGAGAWKTKKTEKEKEEIHKKISESVKKYFDKNGGTIINREKHRKIMTKVLGKKINQYTKEGALIGTYDSIAEATRQTGIKRTNISMTLSGGNKTAGGFIWKYTGEKGFKEVASV